MKTLFLTFCSAIFFVTATAAPAGIGDKLSSLPSPQYLDSKNRTLKEFLPQKKFMVLYLWRPDQAALSEFPLISGIAENFAKQVTFAGVAFSSVEKLQRFPGSMRLGFPINADPKGALLEILQLKSDRLPLALVLDNQGTILWRGKSRALPVILKNCLAGTFNLQEEIRKSRFVQAVNDAVKAKEFSKAASLLHTEWEKTPASLELLNAQISLLTQKLKRPDEAFALLHEAQKKNPGNHRFFEAEYKLLGDPAHEKRVPEFFSRVKKEFARKPGILMAFAVAEMGRPVESMNLRRVLELAETGWNSNAFKSDVELGMFALEYSKIVHTAGRLDLARKLAEIAYPALKSDAKRQALAKKSMLYYMKLQMVSPSIKVKDLKKQR